MQKSFISVIILVSLCSYTLADIGFGKCKTPEPNVIQNFDLKNYVGTWYEQFRAKKVPFQHGECTTAVYSLEGDHVKVNNSELEKGKTERHAAIGKAVCPTSEAKCKVTFGESIFSKFTEGNYWVFDTDYKNYSIIYSCTEYFFFYHLEFVWVLTRERNPSTEVLNNINNGLEKLGYPKSDIREQTYQGDDCVY